jgi:hypothetical protein
VGDSMAFLNQIILKCGRRRVLRGEISKIIIIS